MNKIYIVLVALLAVVLSGCGLTSGTEFVSTSVADSVSAQSDATTLDDSFGGAVVDFTGEDGWDKFTIEGIEDGCVALNAWNNLATPVSGQIWITSDTTAAARAAIQSVADIEAAGGFLVFEDIALAGGPDAADSPQHIDCSYTISRLRHVDQLVEAIQRGYFVAWGAGNEDAYDFGFSGIFFGVHVTGSL